MIPKLFQFGPLPVHSFGFMMVLAFAAGWRQLALALQEVGESERLAEDLITWAAVGGIVGARIVYLLSFPEHFVRDPWGALTSGAGFVFYGGFFGGALACWILVRRRQRSFLQMSDLVAPSLAIAYAVGRIGCQLSGDGDYGIPTNLPWAMSYVLGVYPTEPGVLVHPTPVYETFVSLGIAAVLIALRRAPRFQAAGQVFGVYLVLSSVSRFFVEFLRIEPVVLGGFTQAQVESVCIATIGGLLALGVFSRGVRAITPGPLQS